MNPRPALYERAALPLSYSGANPTDATTSPSRQGQSSTADFEGTCSKSWVLFETVGYDDIMNALAAQVWHFWLAVPLAIGTVLGVVQLIAGYIMKVVAPRYPKR